MLHQTAPLRQTAFSLLELIGVLAVIAVLAVVALPFLIRSIDRLVSDKEVAELNSFAAALERSARRNGFVADAPNLADQIATELGVSVSRVSTNVRNQPRYFWVDPGLQIGRANGKLPYRQTDNGSVVPDSTGNGVLAPVNPRLMIISSLGQPLVGMTHGAPVVTNDFSAFWTTADGVQPPAAVLSGWKGAASDLKIKRINLSPLFVRLVLATNSSRAGPAGYCAYSLTGTNYAAASLVPPATKDGYYFKDSALLLFNNDGSLDSKQVLTRDVSFVYDQNVWRGSLEGSLFLAGMDLRSLVTQFLGAYGNAQAEVTSSQTNVVQSMIDYFNAYIAWAAPPSNFANPLLKSNAQTAQNNMMGVIQGLYMQRNAPAEAICP